MLLLVGDHVLGILTELILKTEGAFYGESGGVNEVRKSLA